MEPWPNLMSEPETALCPTGICGITATALRPRSGDTPSSKCTTGHSTPYVPQACRPMDRSVNFLSMLAPKAGDGEISGIAPGTSHTAGLSCTRARSLVYWPSWVDPVRPTAASATAAIEVPKVKMV